MVADAVHTTPLTIKSQAARRGPAPLELVVAPGAPAHKTQKIEVAAALASAAPRRFHVVPSRESAARATRRPYHRDTTSYRPHRCNLEAAA